MGHLQDFQNELLENVPKELLLENFQYEIVEYFQKEVLDNSQIEFLEDFSKETQESSMKKLLEDFHKEFLKCFQ